MGRVGAVASLLLLACHPNTTRPGFLPRPGAVQADLLVGPAEAIGLLADALRRDSFPLALVSSRDAYLETAWFDTTGYRKVGGRHFGLRYVRVRAWAEPGPPRQSHLTVEAVYRPLADPSEPERELERDLPKDHPVAERVRTVVDTIKAEHGKKETGGGAQDGKKE